MKNKKLKKQRIKFVIKKRNNTKLFEFKNNKPKLLDRIVT